MWPDNETDRDFLNFTGVADTVAEIIVQAKGRPISIGVSGAWGVGKSSMIKLVRQSLEHRSEKEQQEKGEGNFIFVEFNAWLYQGYDDARAALMDVIGEKLTKEAENRKKGIEKAKEFVERIRWFRLVKLGGRICRRLARWIAAGRSALANCMGLEKPFQWRCNCRIGRKGRQGRWRSKGDGHRAA